MLIIRIFMVLAVIGIGGSVIAWMFTGKAHYRAWAWKFFRAAVVVIFVYLALFALERIFVPFV